MSLKSIPDDHPSFPPVAKTGLLLVNLGTPDATDKKSMRRYLKQFLSDKRVVEVPRILWWIILNGIILNTRPKKSGQAYDKVWLKNDKDGSPLRKTTRLQAEYLAKTYSNIPNLEIAWAMRYGNPSIPDKLNELKSKGCSQFLILPMYPQYAAATTATVNDEVYKWALQQRWQPAIRTVPPWHDHPIYIEALAQSFHRYFLQGNTPDHLVLSFHGIPERYFTLGDPYHCHCMKTARLFREKLDWPNEKLSVTFQSRFGSEPWIKPYTDKTLEALGEAKTKSLAIMAPGFSADCLETLEELAMEGKEIYTEAGGKNFSYIPCLNESSYGMNVIYSLVKENLAGWIDV
ncbi:MAG: ferrochelatase [Alphaproteobacteria bacterium]|nr:ferrochelatase [Alphaproteobacteria bacterium]